MEMGEQINEMTNAFPKKEVYNLSSQLRRAIDSVASNISEGAIGQSNPEQKRFMGYDIRSLVEAVTFLHKAERREYISKQEFKMQYDNSFNLMNMMIGFRNKIK